MPYCSNCGAELKENNNFCEVCGTKQEQTPSEPVPPTPVYGEPVQNTPKPAKKNTALFVVIGILAVALIGLGVFYFIESGNLKTDISNLESDVADLQTDVAAKQANINSLQTQLATEKATVAGLQADLAEAQTHVANLEAQLTDITSQLNASQAEVTRLESELAASELEVANLEDELATAMANVASLESDLEDALSQIESLQGELTAIQAKYPLKDFPSLNALQQWLNDNVQTDTTIYADEYYAMALKMQLLAAEDGYYVSACFVPGSITDDGYTFIYNTALVGNTLYAFDSNDTELYNWGTWGR
jgi:peptidoglycan hydrolase CwlO-like protein